MPSELNNSKTAQSDDGCVHQLFEAQAESTPDALAVVSGDQELTYELLNARANQLAHLLRRRGVGPDVCVGLCVERSVEMIVGLLGILKAGGAYVPLNPDHPTERLASQLAESRATILITNNDPLDQSFGFGGETIDLARDLALLEPKTNPASITTTENLVYVIYTSGSTGTPKGVAVRHRNLANYTQFILQRLKIDGPLNFATVSTISADLGNTCIFPALVSGGCLHILGYDTGLEGDLLRDYVARRPIDVLKIVPSHFSALLATQPDGKILPARYLILGGEALSWDLVQRIQQMDHTCQIINHYGPTETTVGSLTFSVDEKDVSRYSATVPIGRPIANTRLYILDRHLRPVPVGVSGELYIGGAGVTAGYLNQPELTAERFIPDFFSAVLGDRLYKTGDLVRCLPDGNLEYVGRLDSQIKLRGFRVELQEIEVRLAEYPAVRDCVVAVKEDARGEKFLAAYIVSGELPNVTELRSFLKRGLPDYMIPAAFVHLDHLPLTANGKIDRQALPKPSTGRPILKSEYVPPQDEIETELASIWEEVLGLRSPGRQDDFFELGGHSLAALQMFTQIEKRLARKLPLATLFEAATISHLATILRGHCSPSWSSLVPIQPNGPKPPLFCVHACGAHVFIYRPLVAYLSPDQPVYGLQAQGINAQEPHSHIEDMAAHYIKEIRDLEPHGPYYLVGDTLGGLIAFEMAKQLKRQGQDVALLAMFDTFCPLPLSLGPRVLSHLSHLRQLGPRKYLLAAGRSLAKKLGVRFSENLTQIGMSAEEQDYAHGISASGNALQRTEWAIYLATQVNYRPPQQRFPGRLTYFLARDNQYADGEKDDRRRWKRWAAEFELHVIPGRHGTISTEPDVAGLAEKFISCLDKTQAEYQAKMCRQPIKRGNGDPGIPSDFVT